MIERILPAAVGVAEAVDDPVDARLFPEEEPVIARAVDKRRREFTTARHCARQALGRIGQPPVAIPSGERGAPRWPEGIAGSITHCEGYRGAAVARVADIASLGIDAEPHAPLPEGVLGSIALATERTWLGQLSERQPETHWDRLLFCAKESIYKTWFPLTGRWLGFDDAEVRLVPDADGAGHGRFVARLLVAGPRSDGRELTGFDGRWLVEAGLIFAAIAVPAERDRNGRTPAEAG